MSEEKNFPQEYSPLDDVRHMQEQLKDDSVNYKEIALLFKTKPGIINYLDDEEKINILPCVVYAGYLEEVKILANNNVDVCKAKTEGVTMLFIAAQCGHLDVVKWLLANGAQASVNQPNNNGVIPLLTPTYNGCLEVITEMVTSGANIKERVHSKALWPILIDEAEGLISYYEFNQLTAIPLGKVGQGYNYLKAILLGKIGQIEVTPHDEVANKVKELQRFATEATKVGYQEACYILAQALKDKGLKQKAAECFHMVPKESNNYPEALKEVINFVMGSNEDISIDF